MITIRFDPMEYYNEDTNMFEYTGLRLVDFEYSLIAIARWEAKWKTPFLSSKFSPTDIRLLDFYLCMSLDNTLTMDYLTQPACAILSKYIEDPQTATSFSSQNESNSRAQKVYTSEQIYALMCMNHVPIEFEERNLSRLFVMLRVISVYSEPPKKMSKQDILRQNSSINEQRKKQYNTRG